MRKWNKIALLLPAAILYCCIASYCANGNDGYDSISSNKSAQQESLFSPVSSSHYGQAIQTRNFVNVLNQLPVYTLKNHLNDCSTPSKATESLLISHFSRYFFYAANCIIRFQPTDIIFPFHYFW